MSRTGYKRALRAKGVKAIPPYHKLRSSKAGDQVIDALAGRVHPIAPLPAPPQPIPTWALVLGTFIVSWFAAAFIMGN